MKQKKEVQVKTIKYQDEELPVIVNYFGNSYPIQKIRIREDNYVFPEGGSVPSWLTYFLT